MGGVAPDPMQTIECHHLAGMNLQFSCCKEPVFVPAAGFAGAQSVALPAPPAPPFRMLFYNIYLGGRDNVDGGGRTIGRKQKISEFISGMQYDVVAMSELNDFSGNPRHRVVSEYS